VAVGGWNVCALAHSFLHMPHDRSTLALASVALLEGLDASRLDELVARCTWRSVDAGQSLLHRDEHNSDVFFVVAGRLRVTVYSAAGKQITFRDLSQGGHFGEIAAIDGQPRSADVQTLAPSVVASLDRAAFLGLLQAEPLVAGRIMQGLAALVRQLSERVMDLSTLGVQNRLHAELLRMARAAGVHENRARLDPAPPHGALASQISTNREQVTRELNALRREGLIGKDAGALEILDVARLERMVALVRGERAR